MAKEIRKLAAGLLSLVLALCVLTLPALAERSEEHTSELQSPKPRQGTAQRRTLLSARKRRGSLPTMWSVRPAEAQQQCQQPGSLSWLVSLPSNVNTTDIVTTFGLEKLDRPWKNAPTAVVDGMTHMIHLFRYLFGAPVPCNFLI